MTFALHSHDEATGQCVWRSRIVRRWRGKRIVTHQWRVGWWFHAKPQWDLRFSTVGDPLDWSGPLLSGELGWFDARPNQWP